MARTHTSKPREPILDGSPIDLGLYVILLASGALIRLLVTEAMAWITGGPLVR